jgi:hypothetical protein
MPEHFLVSAFFWCQSTSGVSTFLVPERFWCQAFSGVSTFLVLEPSHRTKFRRFAYPAKALFTHPSVPLCEKVQYTQP